MTRDGEVVAIFTVAQGHSSFQSVLDPRLSHFRPFLKEKKNLLHTYLLARPLGAFQSQMDKDQTTTPGTTRPTLYDKCVGSLTSPANQYNEDAGDGAYGLSSLSLSYSCKKSILRKQLVLPIEKFPSLVLTHTTQVFAPWVVGSSDHYDMTFY